MLKVRLIGKFDIQYDGHPVILSSRAAQSLFAYLILTAGTLHRREKLAGILWPEESEQKARTYLRHELWRIRKALPKASNAEYLLADNLTVGFNQSSAYWFDVAALKNLSDQATADETIVRLSFYDDELLPGFYEDWVVSEREQLQVLFEQKIACLLDMLEKEQRWQDMLKWAERWVSLAQAPEAAYRALMVAYDALGDHTKVVSAYERCKQALRELDLEPSERTRALVFKRSSKLKIPLPLTSFIGREKELKEVAHLFSKSRLVTLTGSGGVGKTRLAIQVVAEVLDLFPDGVWFLDLTPLSDPALIANTLATLLGLQEFGPQPVADLLVKYFRSRTALVIFDNCEHLIEPSSQLIHSLLTTCEALSILATSREALRVAGEVSYRVPSLAVPRADIQLAVNDFADIESVRLFTERAASISPDFALNAHNVFDIARICQRLDGIPLAIELAAARTNLLSIQQILTGLDDRFHLLSRGLRSALPRHQTLRAMIEWSYDLLTEKERILFRRLAVFAGTWTQEAAEEVCSGNGIELSEVLDLLSQLVNKSLLLVEPSQTGETRYHALETIRQYTREKLIESGEEQAVREKYTRWFVELAERAEPNLSGHGQLEWAERIEQELDNLRAAMEWSLYNDFDLGLRIVNALLRFWDMRDHRIECFHYVEHLFRAGRLDTTPLHARSLAYAAFLAISPATTEQMITLAKAGERMSREVGDQEGLAVSLGVFAQLRIWQGEREQALRLYEENMALLEDSRNLWLKYLTRSAIGWTSQTLGDYERANACFQEALAWSRENGDLEFRHYVLSCFGWLAFEESHYEQALEYFQESVSLARLCKNKLAQSITLRGMGETNILLEQYTQAKTLLEESLLIERELGNPWNPAWTFRLLGRAARLQGDFQQAWNYYVEGLRLGQTGVSRTNLIWCLIALAELAVLNNQPKQAASLLGTAEAIPELDRELSPPERLEWQALSKTIRNQLDGESSYASNYEAGKRMSLEEVVDYVLKEVR
jgi:predicted ATPase/DNA-binding SARP family transcriptional activator/Tfp pilus assembly protein PilF